MKNDAKQASLFLARFHVISAKMFLEFLSLSLSLSLSHTHTHVVTSPEGEGKERAPKI